MDEGWEEAKKYAKYDRIDNPSYIRNLIFTEDWQKNTIARLCLQFEKPNSARAIQGLDLYAVFETSCDLEVQEKLVDMGLRLEWVRCGIRLHTYEFDYARRRARDRALILLGVPRLRRGTGVGITKDVARIIARVVWELRKFN